MLEIKNLHARIAEDGTEILRGVDLTIPDGEVHAIMGPNGSGKSTLSYVIAGKEDYEVTEGEVLLDGQNILEMDPHERANAGLFLAFQYPIEIPGVATMTFLRSALNAKRKAAGQDELSTPDFMRVVKEKAQELNISRTCSSDRSMSVSRAARRSAMKSCRWLFWSREWACSTKPIPASTSMR
jgi:Fe-S cluster assembly ATP-binding protein